MAKGAKTSGGDGTKLVVQNRRARFDYAIDDTYEAGLVLTGTEVKSLRDGLGSLAEAWVKVDAAGEAWLMQSHIPEYANGGYANHHPTRERKLLLHRHQLDRLQRAVATQGVTLVPMRLYFKDGRAKLQVGVGTGKQAHDKRQTIKDRDWKRDKARLMRERG